MRLLDVWADDPRPVGICNYALLRLMIYTGLRRAEMVTLRWDDISFGDQIVTVRHGKGDKRRIAAIADKSDDTINALSALREAQEGACDCIFPGHDRRAQSEICLRYAPERTDHCAPA